MGDTKGEAIKDLRRAWHILGGVRGKIQSNALRLGHKFDWRRVGGASRRRRSAVRTGASPRRWRASPAAGPIPGGLLM